MRPLGPQVSWCSGRAGHSCWPVAVSRRPQANLQVLNPLVLDLMKTVTKQQTEIFDLKKQVDGLEKIRKQVASLEELRKRAPPLPPFLQGDRVKLRKGTIKGISKMEGVIAGRCPTMHAQNFWTIHMPNGNAYGIHETDIIRVCPQT